MVDLTHESTPSGYARRDPSADLLWLTQRTKVNPWEGRASSEHGPDSKNDPGERPSEATPALAVPMIGQADTLRLESTQDQELLNPFEKLIEHQLQLDLGGI